MTISGLALRFAVRSGLQALSLSLGAMAVTAMLTLSLTLGGSARERISVMTDRLGADAIMTPEGVGIPLGPLITVGAMERRLPAGTLEKVRAVEGVETASPELFLRSVNLPCCSIGNVLVIGYDPATDFTLRAWTRGIALGDETALAGSEIESEPGGRVSVLGKTLLIKAKLERTGIESVDRALYVTLRTASSMSNTTAHSAIMLRFNKRSDPAVLGLVIEQRLPNVSVTLQGETLGVVTSGLRAELRLLGLGVLFVTLTGLVLIGSVVGQMIAVRERDLGVIRAIGASRAKVIRLIATETAMITGAGAILGALSGAGLSEVAGVRLDAGVGALCVLATVTCSIGMAVGITARRTRSGGCI